MKQKNKGFTLVELIIAIAITGIITVTIFQIFGGVVLNWKKAEDRMSQNYKINNLYILLSKKLDELYQYKAVKDPEKYFDGQEDSILFISFYSVKVPYFPVTTKIYLDNEKNLIMEETPFFFDRPDAVIPEPVKMTLWKDVDDFKIFYLTNDRTKRKGSVWENRYEKSLNRAKVLIAVRMDIVLKSGQEITVFSYLKGGKDSKGVSGGLL
ncbi:hypothetical protein TTHT_1468 [Thermotomaculum hydrothermale]|uniref:Prepilin-type N-terminal cleavage/methylation domain-containing protein n=1 Tax=Thermotomaculum hydrothermale TaxID=981385 RepID=A0A7R6PPM7_9BACT|nr:prepilin-type N-terminal cleavage/methylation domain-containing protein [Thermotomaculum hydrothermale]BBB32976.1 hypothetical protein TTHT_1468 [Thermotomaculum hydrothermale]